jgi:hypothetical protein
MIKMLILLLLHSPISFLKAEGEESLEKKYAISGHVKDAETGEDLIGATIFIEEISSGTVTNSYGFYTIRLPLGIYNLKYSYIGYEPVSKEIDLRKDITFDVELVPASSQLKEVEVVAKRLDENVKKPEMSVVKMEKKTIQNIPALMGEVDVIKAIQLLPGVQAASEGSSGFVVRGGSPDQNLILLDEATVYNPSHFLGFFSVFNNDAVKEVKLYKGDIPARYGGRLASVLDVKMRDGNSKKFSGTGGIGLISSRLTLEGPIIKNRTSFIVSGRRTYADLFLPLSRNEDVRDNKLYFYDFNAKVNHTFNENNRLYISGYFGRDVFKNEFALMKLGNATATVRWNHVFSNRIFSNFTAIYSRYNYTLGTADNNTPNSFEWLSSLEDFRLKGDFTLYLDQNNTIRFGFSSIYHTFDPGVARGTGEETLFTEYSVEKNHSLESGIYASNEQKLGARWILKYGLRLSMFNNVGEGTLYRYGENDEITDSVNYDRGSIYNTYVGLEPRLGVTFLLDEKSSIKASYARTFQYIQLAQNSTAGTPIDVWFPASPNVKPQIADQVAVGYFRNFMDNTIETSAEIYYKTMQNTIDFKDHAELLLNRHLEGELRFGTSYSYGLELLVRKHDGKLNGWVAYTYARAIRTINGINNDNPFNSPYDVPHEVSVVLNYEVNPRLLLSANWIYATGKPVTFPTGRAVIDGVVLPIYSDRNAYRMEDYHRLDIAVTLKPKIRENRKFDYNIVFSAYNAYNRHNAWAYNFTQDPNDPLTTYAEKTYLFGIIPSVTFNFNF